MGTNSAGTVGAGNEGKTDMDRGSMIRFTYTKSGRKTGMVSGGMSSMPNDSKPDSNKRTVSDPRLA